jgi:hypothetical protein
VLFALALVRIDRFDFDVRPRWWGAVRRRVSGE